MALKAIYLIRKARRQRDRARTDCALVEHDLIHKHKIYKSKLEKIYKKYGGKIDKLDAAQAKVESKKDYLNTLIRQADYEYKSWQLFKENIGLQIAKAETIFEDIRQVKSKLSRVK
jgi:chromosome segregation ATPase